MKDVRQVDPSAECWGHKVDGVSIPPMAEIRADGWNSRPFRWVSRLPVYMA